MMDVWFNFPDLSAFKVQMDQPPIQGSYIRAHNIPCENFRISKDWANYIDKKHDKDEWVVTRVTYAILPTGSYANVMLHRPTYSVPGDN